MSETIKQEFKKSKINATSDFDFYQIERKSEHLLDCKVFRTLDEVDFEFQHNHEKPFEEVRNLSLTFKYQALINIQYLLKDSKRIKISLNPNNLVFDTNMMPKAIMRDVYTTDTYNENEFVKQYKSLIGYVLQNKYTFNDYYQGGNQLLSKNKATNAFAEVSTLNGLLEVLNKEYANIQEKLQHSLIEVDKRKYKRLNILNKIVILLLVLSIAGLGYFGFFRLNEETTFKTANEEYIKQDYISVRETLENVNVDRMSVNTKYILAVSNIKTESLSDEQKNNILASVTLNADERILEFWIYLGKSNMDKAIDLAKQLGNTEYTAYAYMKEKAKVENDKNLSGADREEKLKQIENSLKELDINNGESDVSSSN